MDGSNERVDSVPTGLQAAGEASWVLIHDAMCPCLHQENLPRLLAAGETGRIDGILVASVYDMMKCVEPGRTDITHTANRIDLWRALTPQFFPRELLHDCLIRTLNEGAAVMDEASALEYCGFYPQLVKGRVNNIKVVRPENLTPVEFYLTRTTQTPHPSRCNEAAYRALCIPGEGITRIGHGFGVHAFGGVSPTIIGGMYIPYEKGLLAHSGGDVVLHALAGALLGAAALGDIGKLFPGTDLAFKGVDSRELSCEAWRRIQAKGCTLSNVDVMIIAQMPEVLPYIPQMRVFIAEDLDYHMDGVNAKATTTEKLGLTRRGERIVCEMVVLLLRAAK